MKLRILDAVERGSEITIYLGLPDITPRSNDNWYNTPLDCSVTAIYEECIVASLHILLDENMWVDEVNTYYNKNQIFKDDLEILRISSLNEKEQFFIKLGKLIEFNQMTKNVKSVYCISDFERFIAYVN